MADKKPEFVVSDRRRFAPEGEPRPDTPVVQEEQAPVNIAPPSSGQPPLSEQEEMPAPPSAAEQQEQHEAYKASGKKIDEMVHKAGGAGKASLEMTFERLVESFYMTALLQLGAIRQEGESPQVDILGARQTIDSLSLLQEKTKGNLTGKEQSLLQNVLFELRMAWIEITNAIASAPAVQPRVGGPGINKR